MDHNFGGFSSAVSNRGRHQGEQIGTMGDLTNVPLIYAVDLRNSRAALDYKPPKIPQPRLVGRGPITD
jgi:hypothetical protein